ncbi:MAG TPA: VanZ family protein [Nitrospirota bacterium]
MNALIRAVINKNSRVPGVMSLMITFGILAACLWPFNFNAGNKVAWLQDEYGIRFYGQGVVFSPAPLKMPDAAAGTGALTIELLVRPGKGSGSEWGSILTWYSQGQEQFIFGQWKTNFNVRVPAVATIAKGSYRHLGIVNSLPANTARLITVASGRDKTDIYVNGKLEESAPHYTLLHDDQGIAGYLVLGTSPPGRDPWNGDVLGMAVYGRLLTDGEIRDHYQAWGKRERTAVLSGHSQLQAGKAARREATDPVALYFFNERSGQAIRDHSGAGNQLQVPARFRPFHKPVLLAPWNDRWLSFGYVVDIILNVLGFVPFGFFLSAWLRYAKDLPAARVYGIAILSGFCLSLGVELTQVYLPTRGSQLMDVVTNTLGTALGAMLLFKYVVPALGKDAG